MSLKTLCCCACMRALMITRESRPAQGWCGVCSKRFVAHHRCFDELRAVRAAHEAECNVVVRR